VAKKRDRDLKDILEPVFKPVFPGNNDVLK
jgi:hypothetical protein